MTVDHLFHGLEMKENGILMAMCTHDSIAAEKLVDVASCKCSKYRYLQLRWQMTKYRYISSYFGFKCQYENENDYENLREPDECTEE